MSVRKKAEKSQGTKAAKKTRKTNTESKSKTTRNKSVDSGDIRVAGKKLKQKSKKSAWNNDDDLVGLKRNKYSKIKQEFFDQEMMDYSKKLTEEEKKWLAQFMKEWLGANAKDAKFHKTKKDRKLIFDANNNRNSDIYSNHRASGRLIDYEKLRPLLDELYGTGNYEDDLIDYLDSKKAIKN